MTRSVWQKNVQAAEENNVPGTFTALIGYEWSSNTGGNNLHRVVVFRDGAEKVEQILPFSSLQSDNPEDLWKALQNYETKTGGSVLAIPHNGNLSNGLMYPAGQSRRRTADHRGVCAHPREPGAADGSDPDQGRRGDASVSVSE